MFGVPINYIIKAGSTGYANDANLSNMYLLNTRSQIGYNTFMLELVIVIMLLAWLLGVVVFSLNGLIHVALVIALIVLIVRLLQDVRFR